MSTTRSTNGIDRSSGPTWNRCVVRVRSRSNLGSSNPTASSWAIHRAIPR